MSSTHLTTTITMINGQSQLGITDPWKILHLPVRIISRMFQVSTFNPTTLIHTHTHTHTLTQPPHTLTNVSQQFWLQCFDLTKGIYTYTLLCRIEKSVKNSTSAHFVHLWQYALRFVWQSYEAGGDFQISGFHLPNIKAAALWQIWPIFANLLLRWSSWTHPSFVRKRFQLPSVMFGEVAELVLIQDRLKRPMKAWGGQSQWSFLVKM